MLGKYLGSPSLVFENGQPRPLSPHRGHYDLFFYERNVHEMVSFVLQFLKRRIHDAVVVLYHAQILYVDDIGLMDLYKSVIICT